MRVERKSAHGALHVTAGFGEAMQVTEDDASHRAAGRRQEMSRAECRL
jgi:hypothetical protein